MRRLAMGWSVFLMMFGCSNEAPSEGGSSGGAMAHAGSSGQSSGGAASGGRAANGGSAGRTYTGGRAAAGGSSGGSATGGKSASGGSATGGKSASGGSSGGTTGSCGDASGQLFPPGAPWNTSIAGAALDAESGAVVSYLQANHTASERFRVNFQLTVLTADAATPLRSFNPTSDFYVASCDPAPMPVPTGGCLEGETSYACTLDGDCHLLVIDRPACRLYEMWRANIVGSTFDGGCLAVWQIDQVYPPSGRGENCTSADAGGLPITPLLFTPDEVAAGEIRHAVRFILPNNLIRHLIYVHPATHSTSATSGPASAPPYGARMRLKAGTTLSGLSPAAQVVARALQNYGMILTDGGNVTFTAANDTFATHKWSAVGFAAGDLTSLKWSDFEMVDGGQRIQYTGDCTRTPVTQ